MGTKETKELIEQLSAHRARLQHDDRQVWTRGTYEWIASQLVSAARYIHRASERECSDSTYNRDTDYRRDEHEAAVYAIANMLQCDVAINGDPRGFTIKLRLAHEPSNGWERGVWGV